MLDLRQVRKAKLTRQAGSRVGLFEGIEHSFRHSLFLNSTKIASGDLEVAPYDTFASFRPFTAANPVRFCIAIALSLSIFGGGGRVANAPWPNMTKPVRPDETRGTIPDSPWRGSIAATVASYRLLVILDKIPRLGQGCFREYATLLVVSLPSIYPDHGEPIYSKSCRRTSATRYPARIMRRSPMGFTV